MRTKKGARSEAASAAREARSAPTGVGKKAATDIRTGTQRTMKEAVGGWLVFRDAIVNELPALRIERIRAGAQPSCLVGAAEALGVP